MTKKDLRALAIGPRSGFRYKKVVVPEWEDATVTLREASAGAWQRWREFAKKGEILPDSPDEMPLEERINNNILADVALFVDVLIGDDGQLVFSHEDINLVAEIYGPVHARLLKEALALTNQDIESAGKK